MPAVSLSNPPTGAELAAAVAVAAYDAEPSVAFLIEKPAPAVHEMRDQVDVVAETGFSGDHARKSWWRGAEIPGREVTATALEVLRLMNLGPDVTGDNLVVKGIDLSSMNEGDRLVIGSVVLVRSKKDHRPCALFEARAGRAAFDVAAAGFRGALFTVETGGVLRVGDRIELLRAKTPGLVDA